MTGYKPWISSTPLALTIIANAYAGYMREPPLNWYCGLSQIAHTAMAPMDMALFPTKDDSKHGLPCIEQPEPKDELHVVKSVPLDLASAASITLAASALGYYGGAIIKSLEEILS